METEELEQSIQAKTFKDCIPKMIAHQKRSHPEFSDDQAVAVAYSKCRKMFGIKKANLLRLVESGEIFTDKSLEVMVSTIKKSMDRDDWIDYGVLLKLEGKQNKEITSMIPYKDSWIKKYVNPIFNRVTLGDNGGATNYNLDTGVPEIATAEPKLISKSLISIGITDLKKEKREFGAWGSAEVKDSHGDIISMEAIEAVMPIVMERGGVIMYGHSNRHVGKLLKYKITTKEVNGKQVPAIWLEGRIFTHYKNDDLAWEAVQIAKKTNQPVLSLGATPIGKPITECNQTECHKKYTDLQIYEWTITEIQRGSTGANPEAKVEMTKSEELNFLEKAMTFEECVSRLGKRPEVTDPEKLCGWIYWHVPGAISPRKPGQPVQKIDKEDAEVSLFMKSNSWIAGKLLKMKQEGTIPDSDDELVNLLLANCNVCQAEYLTLTTAGKTETEAKELILQEVLNAMSVVEKEIQEINKDTQETTKEGEIAEQEGADLNQMIQRMMQVLQEILARLPEKKEPPPAEPEPEAQKSKPEESITLVKNLTPDDFRKLAKAHGYQIIKPQTQTTGPAEIQKKNTELATKEKKYPTKEEMIEAIRSGELSQLVDDYNL